MNFNDSENVDEELVIAMEVLRRYEYPDYEDVENDSKYDSIVG